MTKLAPDIRGSIPAAFAATNESPVRKAARRDPGEAPRPATLEQGEVPLGPLTSEVTAVPDVPGGDRARLGVPGGAKIGEAAKPDALDAVPSQHESGHGGHGGPLNESDTGPDLFGDITLEIARRSEIPPYFPQHVRVFAERGIPEDLARHYRLRSCTEAEASKWLQRPIVGTALRIPSPRNDDDVPRYRLDDPAKNGSAKDGSLRYLLVKGGTVSPFVTDRAYSAQANETVVFVEAPLKALALEAAGIGTIGLAGVHGGWLKDETLHAEIQKLTTRGVRFVTLFDSNTLTNANVAHGQARLVRDLIAAGAQDVRIAQLSHAADGSARGPDDARVQEGDQVLHQAIREAKPAAALAWLASVSTGREAADLLKHLPFVALLYVMDDAELDVVAKAFRSHGIQAKNVRSARNLISKAYAQSAKAKAANQDPERYGFDSKGRNCANHVDRDTGAKLEIPLANFGAKIVREEVHDDGVVETRVFAIEGVLEDGTALPPAEVPADDFARMGWVVPKFGARAAVAAGPRAQDQMRESIQVLSRPERCHVYRHTGWREVDGKLAFLFHEGSLGSADALVRLEGPMQRYRLPPPNQAAAERSIRLLLQVLKVAPRPITYALVGAACLAPLGSILALDCALWLVGPTGSLKSELAALVQSFFGDFDRTTLPGSWASTENALEAQMSVAKDVVFVLDDFAPQASRRMQDRLNETAARIVRQMGNGASRGRLTADLKQRPNRPPRCMLICTGEDMPVGASINARLVRLDIDRTEVNLSVLTDLQARRAEFPMAMALYVESLRSRYGDLQRELPARKLAWRKNFHADGVHMRQPDALALLLLGFAQFLEFAVTTLTIGLRERDELLADAEQALKDLGTKNAQGQRHHSPVEVFLGTLRELLVTGSVCLKPLGTDLSIYDDKQPIGWFDADHVYLLMNVALEHVSRSLHASGGHLATSPPALRKLLEQGGMLVRPGDKRLECSIRDDVPIRVTKLLRSKLDLPLGGGADLVSEPTQRALFSLDDVTH